MGMLIPGPAPELDTGEGGEEGPGEWKLTYPHFALHRTLISL